MKVKTMRQTCRMPDELLIPVSAAVRVVNRVLGTSLTSLDEISEYLNKNPEEHARLQNYGNGPKKVA